MRGPHKAAGYDEANVNGRAQINHIYPFLNCESNALFHHQLYQLYRNKSICYSIQPIYAVIWP